MPEEQAAGGGHALVAAMIGGTFDVGVAFEQALRELEMLGRGLADARQG